MTSAWSARSTVLAAVLCLTAGCYNYNPLTTPSPEPGSYLAVRLNDAGSDELARYLGPSVFVVRGRYLGPSDQGGLLVSVSSVETKRGVGYSWEGETVTLPTDAIASLDVRQLSKGRSLLLAGVGAGGLVATTLAFSLLGGGTALGPGSGRPSKQ
ncbi:MAG TPA: hypothetical protein VF919_06825 [Gemmatimonadales bacterium]